MWAAEQRSSRRPPDAGELDLDAAIVELVSRGAVKVPPYPAVAMKVDELVRRGDYGLEQLARLVASDQVLAADALRCANSAFYSRGVAITALNQAIGRIGAKEVVRLAIASGLGGHARSPGPLAPLKRRVWLEALAGAALAQELAKSRRLAADEAFACGLLHDFGKMIGIACIEELLGAGATAHARPLEFWVGTVERYHVELGLVLAAQWKLPQLVSDVMSLHHERDHAGATDARMVELVASVDEVVALLGDRIWLTAEDLGVVSGLTAPECELVSRVLDRLPGFIASFEGAAPAPAPEPSAIAREPAQFLSGPTPVSFTAKVTVGRERRDYQAIGIAPSNLMVTGAAPLPENQLLQVELAAARPFTCWATAKLAWPDGALFNVLLQPFALDGAARAAWTGLLRGDAS